MTDIETAFDALLNEGTSRHSCRVQAIREDITEAHGKDVAEKFYELATSPKYAMRKVIAVVRAYGYKIGKDSVTKHRKRGELGGCNCP